MSETATRPPAPVRFGAPSALYDDLRQAVSAYFEQTGRAPQGGWRLLVKTTLILGWLVASYALLLLACSQAWQAALAAVSLGLAMAGVGFNVMHDGNHGSATSRRWLNRVLGATLDVLGGSSFVWRQKHNLLHHTYTNIYGVDGDIHGNVLLRFAPSQPWRPWHRFQHLYVWLTYAVYPWSWWLYEDWQRLAKGQVGEHRIRRPSGRELVGVVTGKLVFYGWAFVVPVLVRPTWAIVPVALLTAATLGNVLAIVFQLAHCVGEAEFHDAARPQALTRDWAAHQVATTVDFARERRWLGWYLGGLNFQIEHHLFPKVSHVHYPALAPRLEQVCRAHGVRYRAHPSLWAAISANVRWLRRMGQPPAA